MGYFRRRVDRRRAAREAKASEERALKSPEVWELWNGEPFAHEAKRWYLRFSIGEIHSESGRRTGIFVAAGDALDEELFGESARLDAERKLDWFNEHLHAPELSEERAIFFFKSDVPACANRVWLLAGILRDHGREVSLQRLENPGRIVYEDDYQVAVIPWASSSGL